MMRRNPVRRRRRSLVELAAAWLGFSLLACAGDGAARHPAPPTVTVARIESLRDLTRPSRRADDVEVGVTGRRTTVVLVALDGVRWQEVYQGVDRARAEAAGLTVDDEHQLAAEELMPNLHWLIRTRGAALGSPASSAPIAASGPRYVSLPGYIEILSGRHETGCASNECAAPSWHTLVDAFAEDRDAAVVTSWPTIARATGTAGGALVSAGKSLLRGELGPRAEHAHRRGRTVDSSPGYGDYRSDRATAEVGLAVLRERKPDFLFLGLGDTDGYAHRNDYRGYLRALRAADQVLGEVATLLAEESARGRPTLLLVTADHGRGANFADHGDTEESRRVWLVAAGDAVSARGFIRSPEPRFLADIAPTVRAVAGLPKGDEEQGAVLDELFLPTDGPRLALEGP